MDNLLHSFLPPVALMVPSIDNPVSLTLTHTLRYNGHFSRYPLNSPSPFIPKLHILWDMPKLSMSFLTHPTRPFWASSPSNSFNPVYDVT